MRKDRHIISFLKSIIWRILGIIILAIITYIYTRSWVTTTLITFFHHLAFIFIYYFHERFWFLVGDRVRGKKRALMRAFLYEIVLGHLVLGLISYILTGSWIQVSLITITYIENKLWFYIVFDWIWERIFH